MDPKSAECHEKHKHKNAVPNLFQTIVKHKTPIRILRPNPSAKNDPMVTLSVSSFREKFDLFVFAIIGEYHDWLILTKKELIQH